MKLSHGERNQKITDGIFGVLRNLEKQNQYLLKFSMNCKQYAALEEMATKLEEFLNFNYKAINIINEFIDLVNSKEGHYMEADFMDEIFKQTWEECKTFIKKIMKVRDNLVNGVNVIYDNKQQQREILKTGKMKGWKGCKKAKNIFEVMPVTYETMLLIEPPK